MYNVATKSRRSSDGHEVTKTGHSMDSQLFLQPLGSLSDCGTPMAMQGIQRKRRSSVGAIGSDRGGSTASTPASPYIRALHDGSASPGTASSSDIEGDSPSHSARVLKVPDVAIPMQHSLLKRISAFQSKEELLEFVAHYHCLLDLINLVTCLYRLAKMSKEASRGRSGYLAELQRNPTFQLLLRSISSKFLQGHLNYLHTHNEGLKGVDGRCLANLTWALAKLDLSSDDTALTTELALTVAPFVIRSLDSSSPQGLANMLWSYAKLPVAPPSVVMALVSKITDQLVAQGQRPDGVSTFDAQALSNSIWALAHLKSRGMDVDPLRQPEIMRFLNELATAAARALTRPHATLQPPGTTGEVLRLAEAQRYLALVEREFSCQALVNIAWSFATLLGVACCQQPSIHQLFLLIHNESLVRLRCTALALSSGQTLPYVGGGGFNEQALSNAVYAFDKSGLLSSELLAAVFEVSALRLQRGGASHHHDLALFKPQELCTLLKACHANIAPPWVFLGSLLQLLSAHPQMADSWTAAERLELHRACQLYLIHQAESNGQGAAAVSAAMGLVNSLANTAGVQTGTAAGSGGIGSSSVFGSQTGVHRVSGGSGPPSASGYGSLLTGLTSAAGMGIAGSSPRTSYTSGVMSSNFVGSAGSNDSVISTFGQLPSSAASQQPGSVLSQTPPGFQQRSRSQSAGVSSQAPALHFLQQQLLGGDEVTCPFCNAVLRQQDASVHIEACYAARITASGLEGLVRQQHQLAQLQAQQQQVQQQQQAVAHWAAQQQAAQQQQVVQQQQLQNLLAAQLQQRQHSLLGAQQSAQLQQVGLLGLEDFCRPAGAVDASTLGRWTMDAAAASRPPLGPSRRV